MRKYLYPSIAAAVLAGLLAWWGLGGKPAPQTGYRLAKIEQRDLTKSISATGTLSAVITVDVGSEVSGTIKELLVDFNSRVKKNQVVARLSQDSYLALVRQGEAEVALAKANLLAQKATVQRVRAELANAHSNLAAAKAQTSKVKATLENTAREAARRKTLAAKDFISRTEYDAAATALREAQATLEQSQAQQRAAQNLITAKRAGLASSEAQVQQAQAQIKLQQASLDKRRVDLDHTVIRSPVEGVVIARNVDVGQTVAASLQAPVLFTIAQDLSKMQVSASVDEADIGAIREGQETAFTVDAFGEREFKGKVTQIRKAAQTLQNVVTYNVIISADNADLALLPGMTADVRIMVQKRPQVLAVPNAALRFKPVGKKAVSAASPNGMGSSKALAERLAKALEMSPAQKAKLMAGLRKLGEKFRAEAQANPSTSRTGRQRDQMRKQAQSMIMALLSPDQQARYRRILSGRAAQGYKRGTLYRLDDQGALLSVPVRMGVSDGSFTEIRGRGLKPGMEVVLGIR